MSILAAVEDAVGVEIWLDPVTGQLLLEQGPAVVLGVLLWIVSLVLGLFTAKAVMP